MTSPIQAFAIARLPRIEFGPGSAAKIAPIAAAYGRHALLITSRRCPLCEHNLCGMTGELGSRGMAVTHIVRDSGEPTPEGVDAMVRRLSGEQIDVVIAIGGGSTLDEAKAVAGLLRVGNSVIDYLEGVGPEHPYRGPSVPFIAVPTTAGTGSEATKNAVLSRHGEDGFKKSFRDEQLVPEWAIIDPDLIATCPPEVLAANGMDAFTQLLESYVSIRANPFTDALAIEGLTCVREALLPLVASKGEDAAARSRMALAALLSGINLAQTGLGSVHGLAAPLGAFFPIPHGVVCGTLVGAATRVNIEALRAREGEASPALRKYAAVGRLLARDAALGEDDALARLVAILEQWTSALDLPRLGSFGVRDEDLPRVIAHSRGSSMKTNPLVLSDEEIGAVLQARL